MPPPPPQDPNSLAEAVSALNAATEKLRNLPGDVRSKVINQVLSEHTSPSEGHWAKDTVVPYYKEKYGMFVKNILDNHVAPNRSNHYSLGKQGTGLQMRSLVCLVNQGWKWLIDNADPLGKYKILRSEIEVKNGRNKVIFAWKDKLLSDDVLESLVLVKIDPNKSTRVGSWKVEFENFLDSAPEGIAKLEKKGLNLTNEDMDWIKNTIVQLDEFHLIKLSNVGFIILKDPNMKKG